MNLHLVKMILILMRRGDALIDNEKRLGVYVLLTYSFFCWPDTHSHVLLKLQ